MVCKVAVTWMVRSGDGVGVKPEGQIRNGRVDGPSCSV